MATQPSAYQPQFIPVGTIQATRQSRQVEPAPRDGGDVVWEALRHIGMPLNGLPSSDINALLDAGMVEIAHCCLASGSGERHFYRIHVAACDANNVRHYQDPRLIASLRALLRFVNVSRAAWFAASNDVDTKMFDLFATPERGSLFHIFNTIPSPAPIPCSIDGYIERQAAEDLLNSALPGLKSCLYPYQCRAAATMLQREVAPRLELDPALEERFSPDCSTFYYSARDTRFFCQPRRYEACRGGILSETMGLGKTIIALALIVATQYQMPRMPLPFQLATHPKTASLTDMAASSIVGHGVHWKVEFERERLSTGTDQEHLSTLITTKSFYEIDTREVGRTSSRGASVTRRIILAATTAIIVPPNLFKQWETEISKHLVPNAVRVLLLDDLQTRLPAPEVLRTYDILLFTRTRWEQEHRDGTDKHGRRQNDRLCRCAYLGATRIPDCNCVRPQDVYHSPLKYIHLKRLIIDEGHSFQNIDAKAVTIATSMVTVDHRWVISGTPAKDLFEIGLTTDAVAGATDHKSLFTRDESVGAIKNFRNLASFLQVQPFQDTEGRANWDRIVYRHEDFDRKRTYSGFNTSLRRILESMVVRTQLGDVQKDLRLPPLHHKIVQLEPSFFDKITANLFTLVLTANAITSERTDKDYLFHKASAGARHQLVSNLRQSAFFWTGFSHDDVVATIENSSRYLEKPSTNCTVEDRVHLEEVLDMARAVLPLVGWNALSESHELGIFVEDWPAENAGHWLFEGREQLLLTGVSQLIDAQTFVNSRIGAQDDPGDGLAGAGIRSLLKARANNSLERSGTENRSGLPDSTLRIHGEPLLKRRLSAASQAEMSHHLSPLQESASASTKVELPASSPYSRTRIVGTTSSKLSYLLARILHLYQDEKILVFYEGDNIAYYIAQALELLHIHHEIYAKTLKAGQKSEYVVKFEKEDDIRVLLMDVNQAAHGLNVTSASRIFFVNPVCRPNVEAQAIKRAHRIGQAREVFVETLVLSDTMEEKMLQRARSMSHKEHLGAKALDDDGGIREIVQNARLLTMSDEYHELRGQMAPLHAPQQLWGRSGWREGLRMSSVREGPRKRRKATQETGLADTTS